MKEIIKSIQKSEGFKLDENSYEEYEGFIIETDKQKIYIGIGNGQSCCEDFGSIVSEDETEDFINSELISIEIVDTALKTYEVNFDYLDGGDVMFINVKTSKGLLQFVLYNSHNGYYGHSALIQSTQITHFDVL